MPPRKGVKVSENVGRMPKEDDPTYRRKALKVWQLMQLGLTGPKALRQVMPLAKVANRTLSSYAMRMKAFVEEHRLDEDIREAFLAADITPQLMAERARAGLDATRTINVGTKDAPKFEEVDDYGTRLGYLQFVYRVLNPEAGEGSAPVNYVLVINGDIGID